MMPARDTRPQGGPGGAAQAGAGRSAQGGGRAGLRVADARSAAAAARRWYVQRLTAMAMALFVAVHLGVMIWAMRGGLSAAEILGRTRESVGWALFYGVFVLLAALHAGIGLRAVLAEWTPLPARGAGLAGDAFAALLLVLGWRAVWAVTWAGAA